MLGWRGASRYYHPGYKEGFLLEVAAVKRVREEFGLANLKVMIPFCRTPEEGERVLATMKEGGLVRGERGLEVYVMAEIPSNILLAEEFAEIFDGFSIGSNDLTQLVLGVDRDSATVAPLFDERNAAVKWACARLIEAAHASGRKVGICGQAPSRLSPISRRSWSSAGSTPSASAPTRSSARRSAWPRWRSARARAAEGRAPAGTNRLRRGRTTFVLGRYGARTARPSAVTAEGTLLATSPLDVPPEPSMLLEADEDARARVDAADEAARARVEAARLARERRRADRLAELRLRLDAEVQAIRAEAEGAVAERRRRRASSLDARGRAAEAIVAHAAEVYARMVREGPPRAGGAR